MFKQIVILPEFADHVFVPGWRSVCDVVIKQPSEVTPNDIVVCSGDLTHEPVRRWLERGQPAIYIARGYLGNHLHKQRKWWRATINGWANLQIHRPPASRWEIIGMPVRPVKPVTTDRVLIAPSKMTTEFWSGQKPHEWAEQIACEYSAETRIRYKAGKSGSRWATLFEDLEWANLVVSQSSAITVEAAWYGCQTRSTEPCPTWCLTEDRQAWLEHIAWSQFSNEEWWSGQALELIYAYHGDPREVKHPHEYQFTY